MESAGRAFLPCRHVLSLLLLAPAGHGSHRTVSCRGKMHLLGWLFFVCRGGCFILLLLLLLLFALLLLFVWGGTHLLFPLHCA